MHEIKKALKSELQKYEGKGISTATLDIIHKLTDTIKNIDKIEMLENSDEYSRAGEWEAHGEFGRYDDGNSYARRGTHYVRGHYSRDTENDRGYDDAESESDMLGRLEQMMDRATREKDREAIRRCISQLKS